MLLRKTLFLLLLVGGACRPNAHLPQGQFYNARTLDLQMHFPGQINNTLEYDQFGRLTRRTYQRYLNQLAPAQNDKLLYYGHTVDYPHQTSYTGLGRLIPRLDTTVLKNNGFYARQINSQPYWHKRAEDRTRRLITSEFVVKVDSGYFYLFSYAPTRHLLPNVEDVIIAQDSLNRKHLALISSLIKK